MKHLISVLILLSITAPAAAGEITRKNAYSDFEWKSTECAKPIPKPAMGSQSKEDRLMAYATDIEIYIDCIQREAQRDFQEAQAEMQKALERDLEKDVQVMNDMMLNAAKTMR